MGSSTKALTVASEFSQFVGPANYWSTGRNGQNFDIAKCLPIIRASNSPFFPTSLVQPILQVHTVQNIENGEEQHYNFIEPHNKTES